MHSLAQTEYAMRLAAERQQRETAERARRAAIMTRAAVPADSRPASASSAARRGPVAWLARLPRLRSAAR